LRKDFFSSKRTPLIKTPNLFLGLQIYSNMVKLYFFTLVSVYYASCSDCVSGFATTKTSSFVCHGLVKPKAQSRATIHVESGDDKDQTVVKIPAEAQHSVLRQVYPYLLDHIKEYGHPNIPLGSSAGKKCSTLRRLYLDNKLLESDQTILEELGFTFLSFDDIYFDSDFDLMLMKLMQYEKENQTNYQIPKKYAPDPQLGAWVTNLRRLGPDGVNKEHAEKLNNINFTWKSNRSCGSSFMKQWRKIVNELSTTSITGMESLSTESKKWIKAQATVYKRGDMSETRLIYMNKLTTDFGLEWSHEE